MVFTGIVNFLLGIPLLVWGRKLFWLFVGAVGFVSGFWLADRFLVTNKEWILLLVGLGLGLIGIMLALAVQKFALTLAGFAAGLYLGYRLVTSLSVNLAGWDWLVVVIGGVIGSLLILSVFEWALILLSSLIGASLITQVSLQATHLQTAPRMIIFAVLVLVGVFIQSAQKQRDPV